MTKNKQPSFFKRLGSAMKDPDFDGRSNPQHLRRYEMMK
jgi:hypothetical protein